MNKIEELKKKREMLIDKYNKMDKGKNKSFDNATFVWIKIQKLDTEIKGLEEGIEIVEKMIKERKKTLRFEVKLYEDEQRGDREIELDYLLNDIKKLKETNETN